MSGEEPQHGISLPRLTFRLPPDPSRLLRARERLRDYLEQYCSDPKTVDDVILAVQEACTNAIRHSGSREDIEVSLRLEESDLIAGVRDRGRGFDTEAFDLEAAPGLLAMGGRGLYLMAHVMDDLELRRDGGLEVLMVKRSVVTDSSLVPAVEGGLAQVSQHDLLTPRQARLHVLLEEIDEGFVALDWEYRVAHLNTVAEQLAGVSREDVLNRDFRESFPLHGDVVDRACRDAMELGRPSVVERECPASGRWFEIRVYPTLAGISLYLRAIDERKRSEEAQRLTEERLREKTDELLERTRLDEVLRLVERLINSTLEVDEIMHRALDETLLALRADAGTVEMREDGEWLMRFQRGGGPGEHGRKRGDAEVPIAARVAFAKAVVAVEDLAGEKATAEFAREHDVKSCLAVPLIIHESVVGCLIVWCRRSRVFSPAETGFALKLGSSVSLALESSRLYEREAMDAGLGQSRSSSVFWRVISRSQVHPLWVFLVSVMLLAALLIPIGAAADVHSVYHLPSSLVTLAAIMTGALAGARIGAATAAVGGGIFFVVVAERGSQASVTATLISMAIWIAAALVSGYLAEGLRAQAERRRAAAIALGKAAAVREAGLAEQRRVESLAAELRVEREQLRTMIEQTDTSIVILDRDFNFLVANTAFARSAGREPDELVGLNYFALAPSEKNEAIFRQARETGELVESLATPFDSPHQPERGTTYWDWRLAPVRGEGGMVRTLVLSLIDVTERVQSVLLGETLNAINARVSARLDALSIQTAVLELAGEALGADGGLVVLKRRGRWRPTSVLNMPAGLESQDFAPEEVPFAELALREERPVFASADGEGGRTHPAFTEWLGAAAHIAIPLRVTDVTRGCLCFTYGRQRQVSATEIDFARKVGAVVSQALENARLLHDIQRVATTLQENLIHPLGAFPGLELGRVSQTAYQPELVGGDFSHVFRVGEGSVGVLIGDVEGKGIRAAGLTETVRSAVVAFSLVDPAPDFVLAKVNQLLLEGAGKDHFVTAFLLLVDLGSGETSYATAGHPAPVLLRSSSCEPLDVTPGLPLGAFLGAYDPGRVTLAYGDCLILFTDGVTEARREGELFGEQRVLSTVRELSGVGAQEVSARLREAASEFASELRDDLQILTVRYLRR